MSRTYLSIEMSRTYLSIALKSQGYTSLKLVNISNFLNKHCHSELFRYIATDITLGRDCVKAATLEAVGWNFIRHCPLTFLL